LIVGLGLLDVASFYWFLNAEIVISNAV
jgi:hypothetical protein